MEQRPNTALESREGLPEALRVLVDEIPRATWEAHPNFTPLTRFWLDRHLMFRDLLGRLGDGTRAFIDGQTEAPRYGRETARYAQLFLSELHAHHGIEDHHYFPVLEGLDGRLGRGFALLDADHAALDGHMHDLANGVNAALGGLSGRDPRAAVGVLEDRLSRFATFLDRHLTDEEDLVVPVILRHAPQIG